MPATPNLTANFPVSTIKGGTAGDGFALGISDTTLRIQTADASLFPSPASSRNCMILLGPWIGPRELVKCTARSTNVLTITRAQEGTSAAAWPVGTTVEAVWTAADINGTSTAFINHVVGTYNVRDYGALGDGSTDDTTAITAAISAANSASGGTVYFPAGTYITTTQTIYANVHYCGDGRDLSVIKLKAAANADLFSAQTGSVNLAAANKTGADGSVYGFSFRNLTLDGNSTNQSSGTSWCLRFYAYHYIMAHLDIRNGFSGCVLADWNGPDNQANSVSMESQWHDVKVYTTLGGPIMQYGGPHDSQFTNVLIFDGKNTAYDGTGSLTPGLHIGPNAAGTLFTNVHSWNNNLPFLVEAECYFANCVADISNRGTNPGIGLLLLSSLVNWTGGTIFGSSGSATSTGVYVGQTAGATPKSPYMTAISAGVTTAVTPNRCYMDTVILNTDNGGVNFVNSGGHNIWSGLIHCGSGSSTGGIQGTIVGSDTLRLRVANITPDGNNTTGGAHIIAVKSKQALSVADPANGHETMRVDTFNNRLQYTFGASMLGYSDSFTTKKWSINEDGNGSIIIAGTGNLSLGQSSTAPVIAGAGTITTAGTGVSRLAPAGAVTGIIMQSGTIAGQTCIVVNESAAANSITFNATPATSHVASGAEVIAGVTAATFVWDSSTSLWYRSK